MTIPDSTTPDVPKCPYNSSQSEQFTYSFKEISHQNIFLKLGSRLTEGLSRLSVKSFKNLWFMVKHNNINEMLYAAWNKKDLISKCRTILGTVYITANPEIMKTVFQNPRTSAHGLFWDEDSIEQLIKTLMADLYPEEVKKQGIDKVANLMIFTATKEYVKELRAPLLTVLGASAVKEYIPQFQKIADDILDSLTEQEKMNCDPETLSFEFAMIFFSKIITGYHTTRENYLAFENVVPILEKKAKSKIMHKPFNAQEEKEYQQALLTMKAVIESTMLNPEPALFFIKMKEAGWDDFKIRINLFLAYVTGIVTVKAIVHYVLLQLAKVENKPVIEKLRDPLHGEDYVAQVFAEAVRLHPTSFIARRQLRNDTLFEAFDTAGKRVKRIKLLRKHMILCPSYLAGTDPWKFPDPMTFNPDRFAPDNIRSQLSWYPFGSGPHVCPGQYFALEALHVIISNMVNKFDIEFVEPAEGEQKQLSEPKIKLIDRK